MEITCINLHRFISLVLFHRGQSILLSSVTRILLGGGVSVSDTYRIRIRPGYVSSRILKKQIHIGLDTRIRYVWARWDMAQSSSQPN